MENSRKFWRLLESFEKFWRVFREFWRVLFWRALRSSGELWRVLESFGEVRRRNVTKTHLQLEITGRTKYSGHWIKYLGHFIKDKGRRTQDTWHRTKKRTRDTKERTRDSIHSTLYRMVHISTKHSSSELRIIRTNVHRVDSYFLHLTMHYII